MGDLERFSRMVLMIQEAALAPERWNGAVSRIVEEMGAAEGIMFSPFLPPSAGGFWASRAIQPGHMEHYATYYYDKDVWINAMKPGQMTAAGHVFRDEAIIDPQDVRRSEFYNDFCRQLDIGRLMCGVVFGLDSVTIPGSLHLSLFKPISKDGFNQRNQRLLERLMPHLQAAVKIHYTLGARAHDSAMSDAAWNALTTPVLIVDCNSKVLFANSRAQGILSASDGLSTQRQILTGSTAMKTADLRRFVAKLFESATGSPIRHACRIDRPSGLRPYACFGQALQINAAMAAVRTDSAAVLFIHDPDAGMTSDPEPLMTLNGFTKAEAMLANMMAGGMTLEEAALKRDISYETARTQLKNLFRKTGCRRQAELVALLVSQNRD